MKILPILALSLISSASFSQGKPQLTLKEVRGGGSGCHVDENGKPTDWSVVVDNTSNTLRINFDNFSVDSQEKINQRSCKIRIYVDFPQGTTFYAYSSEVIGLAEMADGDTAYVATQLEVPGRRFPKSKTYKIPGGWNGKFESGVEKYEGSQNSPCGGDNYKLSYTIDLALDGKDSFAQISSKDGNFTQIKYELKKCD